MRRIFCDGCWEAGKVTDLTNNEDASRVPFLDSHAKVLDLCKTCVSQYERFKFLHEQERRQFQAEFKKRVDVLIEDFWKEVRANASPPEEGDIHTAQIGSQIRIAQRRSSRQEEGHPAQ